MTLSTKPIRVMLVDDHKSFLWGVNKLIESEKSKMEVVGQARNRAEALSLAQKARPDVILLDLDLGRESSLDFLPDLLKESVARVLILTGVTDPKIHDRAIELGASGVVLKEESAEIILKAIEKVHGGELWLDRGATARVFAEFSRRSQSPQGGSDEAKISSLTPKEREVIHMVVTEGGATNKQIADRLNMSIKTLSNHLTVIYDKLGVENRLGLFMYATKHDLDKPSS